MSWKKEHLVSESLPSSLDESILFKEFFFQSSWCNNTVKNARVPFGENIKISKVKGIYRKTGCCVMYIVLHPFLLIFLVISVSLRYKENASSTHTVKCCGNVFTLQINAHRHNIANKHTKSPKIVKMFYLLYVGHECSKHAFIFRCECIKLA